MEKVARPFRVCLTGAESTGKTELARELATHFRAPCVPEYSREYAERVARELSYMDVYPIARGQMELEKRLSAGASDVVILDTDLLSTVVYSRHHFGACPIMIESLARTRLADLYLLLDIDVPWIADPVRDSGATRDSLHDLFCDVLDEYGATVRTIAGPWDERLKRAIGEIEGVLTRPRDSSHPGEW
jgi:HTH-type transcriptional regulator, transcriptional repressor of NAD biosynthesis genes